jgi:NitT/TauT family transport system substrate-binding protein
VLPGITPSPLGGSAFEGGKPMPVTQSRRQFLTTLSLAAAARLVSAPPALAAEGPLETTLIRLVKSPVICIAPEYVAEELLRAEGFTDIRYIELAVGQPYFDAMARGEADLSSTFALNWVNAIDAGAPVTVLGGMHIGCYQLFAQQSLRGIVELKGRTVGLEASPPNFLKLMAAQVGLDPGKDIHWITAADSSVRPLELFAQGKIDAFLAFPPEPQELRARKAGHVIVDTTLDRPWSLYFCCMIGAASDYVRKYPVATKRAIRAIFKGIDLCVTEPERVAQRLVDGGFTGRYDYASQTLTSIPYDKWREYDPEDTMRFYALRLYEAGLIKTNPNRIIADHTDWRFFSELRRELKA